MPFPKTCRENTHITPTFWLLLPGIGEPEGSDYCWISLLSFILQYQVTSMAFIMLLFSKVPLKTLCFDGSPCFHIGPSWMGGLDCLVLQAMFSQG